MKSRWATKLGGGGPEVLKYCEGGWLPGDIIGGVHRGLACTHGRGEEEGVGGEGGM